MQERVLVSLIYSSAPGVVEEYYSSKIEFGGEGFLEFTDFTAPICCDHFQVGGPPDEDLFGFVSGNFDLLLHRIDDLTPLRVRGAINLAPLSYALRDPFRDY